MHPTAHARCRKLLVLVSFFLCAPGLVAQEDEGFVDLFNGTDLTGWVVVGGAPETWSVVDGAIRTSGQPRGFLRTERMYQNYVLELEWKHTTRKGNAGLMILADPLPQCTSYYPSSIEVQAMDGDHGSLFGIRGSIMTPLTNPRIPTGPGGWVRARPTEKRAKPFGQWNHYRLEVRDGAIDLAVNGKVVTRCKDATHLKGFICLEAEKVECLYRNIRIKELNGEPPPPGRVAKPALPFRSLFNGLDFRGWKFPESLEGRWSVDADNVIQLADGAEQPVRKKGMQVNLVTEESFRNHVLVADWLLPMEPELRAQNTFTPDGLFVRDPAGERVLKEMPFAGDSGIYVRGAPIGQVNIWSQPMGSGDLNPVHKNVSFSEAIRRAAMPAKHADNPFGTWNRFVIAAVGDRVWVRLNGEDVIRNAQIPGLPETGPVLLQNHKDPISFRNLYVLPLPDDPAATSEEEIRQIFDAVPYASEAHMRRRPPAPGESPPNIVFIMADDLGYAELGSYGQKKFRTPNIDRLAREGMRFTQFYSGSPVCAPSRCTVLTGLHTGHAQVRHNKRIGDWDLGLPNTNGGQHPLKAGTKTIGHILQQHGYDTAFIGKWGLGRAGSSGEPRKQGFDRFFGYLCQRQAHTHYPEFLFDNETVLEIPENFDGKTVRHSHDMMTERALDWLGRRSADKPFFLYLAPAIPHVPIQASPEAMAEYNGAFAEPRVYKQRRPGGYASQAKPRTGYAAMIHMLDRDVGRLLGLLDKKGWSKNTIVAFTSDNGPAYNGGTDSTFFGSAGGFAGLKNSVLEGGIRVPFLVRWPERVQAGAVSEHVGAAWDLLPTFASVAGAAVPDKIDGLSLLPELTGEGEQEKHTMLYWELAPQRALLAGDWKLVLNPRNPKVRKPKGKPHLYHLGDDPGETVDLAQKHPEQLARLMALLEQAHTPHPDFPLVPAASTSKPLPIK